MLDRELLFKFLSGVNIGTGSLAAYYSFKEVVPKQHVKIFNSLYATGDNFVSGQSPFKLDAAKYPGYSLGYNNKPVSGSITGSGYFGGSDLIKIGYRVDLDEWTVFFNYRRAPYSEGYEKILLSSADTPSSVSGFSVGHSDMGFVNFKGYHSTGRATFDLPAFYGKQDLISVSKASNNIITLGRHNIHDSEHNYFSSQLSSFTKSDQWYIGAHNGIDTYDEALLHNVTGYKGYIDDFVLFNKEISNPKKEQFSEFFGLSGYSAPTTGLVSGAFSGVTGQYVNATGVIGTKLSGYTTSIVQSTSTRVSNKIIQIYKNTPVYNDLTGRRLIFESGSIYFRETGTLVPEKTSYNSDYLKRFSFTNANFYKSKAANSIVEVISFTTGNSNTNKDVDYIPASGHFEIDDKNATSEFNVFVSGLYKSPEPVNIVSPSSRFVTYTNGTNNLQTGLYEFEDVMAGQTYTYDASEAVLANPQDSLGVALSGSIHDTNLGAVIEQVDPKRIVPRINKLIFFHKTPTEGGSRFSSFPIKLRPSYTNDYSIGASGIFKPSGSFGTLSSKVVCDLTASNRVLYHRLTGHTNGPTTVFDGSGYLDKDVYKDGIRLHSGGEYYKELGKATLKTSVGVGADIFFVPRPTGYFTPYSGLLLQNNVSFQAKRDDGSDLSLLDEQIWREGKREKKTTDYIRTVNDGVFNATKEIGVSLNAKNNYIFSGDVGTGFFNQRLTSTLEPV